jgi:glucans biosynthesis protein C
MDLSRSPSATRVLCLDNARYIMVLLIVAFHVSAGYSGLNEFYIEADSGGFFLTLRNLLANLPIMQAMFFVAGYFALPSLRGRSYGQFLANKFKRLGIPLLLCILFLGPLMPYLGYYSQSFNGLSSASYWDFWASFLKSGFTAGFTPVVFTTNPQFHQMHYWFLSVLLQFFLLFALGHAAWKKWGHRLPVSANPTTETTSFTKVLLVAALLIGALKSVGNALGLPGGLFAFLLHSPLTSIFVYGGFFVLGIYVHGHRWFVDGRVPGLRTFFALLGSLVLTGLVGFGIYKLGGATPPMYLLIPLGSFFESLLVIWFLVAFIGLTHRYMNRPSEINAKLAANSYLIYLVHYPLILVFRLMLLTWDGPVFLKFSIVLLLSGLVSYLLSQYLIRPFRRTATVGLIGLHIALCVVGLPRSSYSHLLLERSDALHAVVPKDSRPERLNAAQIDQLDGRSRATPVARLSWQDGVFYSAYRPGGLRALMPDGSEILLDPELELGDLIPLANGHLAAVDIQGKRIVELDVEGRILTTLVDSSSSIGLPGRLVGDIRGGIYFTAKVEGSEENAIYYFSPEDRSLTTVKEELPDQTSMALAADGSTLFLVNPEDNHIWASTVLTDGSLGDRRRFAELFLGNGRYGRPPEKTTGSQAEGMTTDDSGRLYVATRFGVQLFSPSGELLGVVNFPDVLLSWNPKRPQSCVFGGPDLSTLYVSYGDEIYTLRTRTTGFRTASPWATGLSLDAAKTSL